MAQAKILLVDDENDIVEFLSYNLEKSDYEVITAFNGEEALEKLTASNPDLIILDVMMPKMDGFEVCDRIREMENFRHVPIIFLTAKSSETDEVHALTLGADDFIQKPISPKKLIARVKSNLRRFDASQKNSDSATEFSIGPIVIDRAKFTVKINGEEVFFPKKEFEILAYLASQPGRVFHRDKLLNDIWGSDIYVVERTVDVHVRKIREKLGENSDLIETVKGVGYRFRNIE